MKHINSFLVTLIAIAAISTCALADFTQVLNYQGRLIDANGVPLADGSYNMTFSIYDASTGGTLIWSEPHNGGSAVTVADGMFSVILGGSAVLTGVDFNGAEYWLEVTIGVDTYSPRQRLTATAMALNVRDSAVTSAKVLDNSLTATDLNVNVVSSVDGVTNDGGNIDMVAGSGIIITPDDGANTITITADPSTNDVWVNTTGDTMTGALNMTNVAINLNGASADLVFNNAAGYIQNSAAGAPVLVSDTNGLSINGPLISTVANGTTPMSITSLTLVTNLNADMLDGLHESSFFNLSQNETVSGIPAFNGGTSGSTAPFTADSTFLVSNLNADLLDGQHGSYYMTAATDNWVNTTGDTMTGGLTMSGAAADILFNNAGATISNSASDVQIADAVTITGVITNTVADGTSPMAITSTTLVTNLNADRLDGQHGSYYMTAATDNWVNTTGDTMTGQLTSTYNTGAPFVITSTTVNTNLNSDMLDGYHAGNSSGNVPVSNGTLNTNLNADLLDGLSEADFFRLSQSETVTGIPAFNGGTSGSTAPFTADSTFLVTNLNADLLDGQHGAYYMPAATDNWVNTTGDTMSGDLNMGAANITNVTRFDSTAVPSFDKIRVWSGAPYAIGMNNGLTYGGIINDYAMTFTMNNSATRGFLWRDDADAVTDAAMSLTTAGVLKVKGAITAGDFICASAGCINSTEIADDYVFNTSDTMSGSLGVGTTLSVGTTITATGVIRSNSGFDVDGNTVIDDAGGWHRTYGNTGWYNSTYAGGWYMTDTTYVKVYNGKKIWAPSYYDSDNTAYYMDPNGNTVLNRLVSVANTTMVTNLNADLLDGYHASTTRNAANTIPIRDASGYMQLGWINTTSGSAGTAAVAKIYGTYASDDYLRYYTPNNFKIAMGTTMSCHIRTFSVGTTSNCDAGTSVVAAMDTSYRIQNPGNFTGAPTGGYMVCCPTLVW